jgi:type VI secretion system protein VasD
MSRGQLAVARLLLAALACVSCGKTPPPEAPKPPDAAMTIAADAESKLKAPMTISAASDANPDANGRPSPIVIRVYQLRADTAFNAADFFALFDDDQKTLGAELISRDEFTVAPADSRTIDVVVSGQTRFVGAIAAFRDIRNSQWRMLVPAPRKGLTVAVEKTRVVVSALN